MKRLLDAKEAGKLLGVPPTWLLAQARLNAVPHLRLGKYVRFDLDELNLWLKTTRRGPSPNGHYPIIAIARTAMSDRPWFLKRFDGVIGADERYRATCPLCGGRRRVSIDAGEDRWLVNCYGANGNRSHVREAIGIVGLSFDDLLFESTFDDPSACAPSAVRGVDRKPLSHDAEVDHLLRLNYVGRLADVPRCALPPLPGEATEPMRRVASFVADVHTVREWAGMEPSMMLSSHWIAEKIGLPQKTVWRALRALVAAGVLQDAGRRPGRQGNRGPCLYASGTAAASQAGELPALAHAVEADRSGTVDQRQEVCDDAAVLQAEADDRREVTEGGNGVVTAAHRATLNGAIGG